MLASPHVADVMRKQLTILNAMFRKIRIGMKLWLKTLIWNHSYFLAAMFIALLLVFFQPSSTFGIQRQANSSGTKIPLAKSLLEPLVLA